MIKNNRNYLFSIIIPVYNNINYTLKCLEGIAQNTIIKEYEVIVVDNGSTDGTKESLQNIEGDFTYIRNEKNLGFAKANNIGAKKAHGKYLVFLNNDTYPLKGWLSAIYETFKKDNKIGIVGAKLFYEDETIQHAGQVWSKNSLIPYHIYLGFSRFHPAVNKEREFQAVTGACMAIPTKLFFEVGGFDENYKNGSEDTDLCFKVRNKGYKIIYQPKCEVYHYESKTPGRGKYIPYNRTLFVNRWQNMITPDEEKYYREDFYKILSHKIHHISNDERISSVEPVITLDAAKLKKYIKNILIIKPSGIGNMIMFTPSLKALKKTIPHAKIDIACYKPEADVIKDYVNKVIVLKVKDKETNELDVEHLESIISDNYYDIALYPPFTNLGKPTVKLKHKIPYHLWHREVFFFYRHEVEHNMDLVREFGYDGPIPDMQVPVEKVNTDLPENFICIHVGASTSIQMQRKKWKTEYWIELLSKLVTKYPLVFLGSDAEKDDVNKIISSLILKYPDRKKYLYDFTGKLSLRQSFGIINECFLFLSNDTGLMHAAAALKKPLLAIFGPTSLNKNKPWGNKYLQKTVKLQLPCQPCYLRDNKISCYYRACLEELKPKIVYEEVKKLIRFLKDENYYRQKLESINVHTKKDLVTVLIPTYNRPGFLKRAIESIINQTYKHWKLFVLNDGGESVEKLIASFNDKRIKYFNFPHIGKSAILNNALKIVRTPYVAYLDDDDIHYPKHLEICLEALLDKPFLDAVYTDTWEIILLKESETIFIPEKKRVENYLNVNYDMLISKNYINHKNLVHRTEIALKIGGYDENLKSLIDWDFIRRLFAYTTKIMHIRKITGEHYIFWDKKEGKIKNLVTGYKDRDPVGYYKMLQYFYSKDLNARDEVLKKCGWIKEIEEKKEFAENNYVNFKIILATELKNEGKIEEAKKELKPLIEENLDHIGLYITAGEIYIKTFLFEKAYQFIMKGLPKLYHLLNKLRKETKIDKLIEKTAQAIYALGLLNICVKKMPYKRKEFREWFYLFKELLKDFLSPGQISLMSEIEKNLQK